MAAAYGSSEAPLVAALYCYACERINHIWSKLGIWKAFTIDPSRRASDSALADASGSASNAVCLEHIL